MATSMLVISVMLVETQRESATPMISLSGITVETVKVGVEVVAAWATEKVRRKNRDFMAMETVREWQSDNSRSALAEMDR